jgi:hypothetical protein
MDFNEVGCEGMGLNSSVSEWGLVMSVCEQG